MDKQNIREALRQLGSAEEIRRGFEKFRANIDFFRNNHGSLMERHPSRWVAMQDEQVVATSKSLRGLMPILKRSGIDTGTCYIQFLDPNPKPQILVVIQARVSLAFSYTPI